MTDIITRSIEEITASAKMNMQDMINRAIALGKDFIDAKETLGHGKFLPWLEKLGVSSSTASNYMKVAREIAPDSKLATLPYSKALALLAAPADEREALAEEAQDKSAAQIRKLIEEKTKALEAANVVSNKFEALDKEHDMLLREMADKDQQLRIAYAHENTAKREIEALKRDNKILTRDIEIRKENAEELNKALKEAREQAQTIEKIVAPADYQTLKDNQQMLIDAATEAEARAAEAEAKLEEAINNGGMVSTYEIIHKAMKIFFVDCEILPWKAKDLAKYADKIACDIERLNNWSDAMQKALVEAQISAEGRIEVI